MRADENAPNRMYLVPASLDFALYRSNETSTYRPKLKSSSEMCTDGSKGSSDREVTEEELAATRREEQINAGKVLGLKDVVFLDYPDSYLQPTLDLRKDIARERSDATNPMS